MKVNVYYRTVIRRPDHFKKISSEVFMELCSWPRILIENISRSNLGERYFNFGTTLLVIIILGFLPFLMATGFYLFASSPYYHQLPPDFYVRHATWYIYLGILLICSIKRKNEIKRLPSVFDFGRFSLSTGRIHPLILNLKWRGKPINLRVIETLVEPGIFFIAGFVLWNFGQNVGMLLMISSFFYSLSYYGAYYQGDQLIMDRIDEILCKQYLGDLVQEGREPENSRGFRLYGKFPEDPEKLKLLVESFEEEVAEVS